jgi:hypothetical protein
MAKRAALVSQYLENISRAALEEYQNIIRQYVRNRQGVYALYKRGKLYYVGLATNLRMRLSHHLRDRHAESWDRFSIYLTIGHSHLKELESLLLRISKPIGNKQKGKFFKSEDLRNRFRHDIKCYMDDEIINLIGKKQSKKPRYKKVITVKGRKPVLAEYGSHPFILRAFYKGKLLKARVRRDGKINFGGRIFYSPSFAGAAACKRRSCNGWSFWQYERAPGDWVLLNELRE